MLCEGCGDPIRVGAPIKKCKLCGQVYYHNKTCWRGDQLTHEPICRISRSEKDLSLRCGLKQDATTGYYIIDCPLCRDNNYCIKPVNGDCPKFQKWRTLVGKSKMDSSQAHAHLSTIQKLCSFQDESDLSTWTTEIEWLSSFATTNAGVINSEERWLLKTLKTLLKKCKKQAFSGTVERDAVDDVAMPTSEIHPDKFAQYVHPKKENLVAIAALLKITQQIVYTVCCHRGIDHQATVTPELIMKLARFIEKIVDIHDKTVLFMVGTHGAALKPPTMYHTYVIKERAAMLLEEART